MTMTAIKAEAIRQSLSWNGTWPDSCIVLTLLLTNEKIRGTKNRNGAHHSIYSEIDPMVTFHPTSTDLEVMLSFGATISWLYKAFNGTEGDSERMKGAWSLVEDNAHNCVPSSEGTAEGQSLCLSVKRGWTEKMLMKSLPGTLKIPITGNGWTANIEHTDSSQSGNIMVTNHDNQLRRVGLLYKNLRAFLAII